MLKRERIQEREEPVPETHRVQLTGDQLSVANRGIDTCERDCLLVERDPDLLDMRDRLMIKEVVGPGLRSATNSSGLAEFNYRPDLGH